MASNIKIVGFVGTGVVGASWIALFLAEVMHLLVMNPRFWSQRKPGHLSQ